MTTQEKSKQLYLGDGVYLDSRPDALILTTSNGLGTTNTIVLETEVLCNLLTVLRVDVPAWLKEKQYGG